MSVDPLEVRCPRCEVAPGERCRSLVLPGAPIRHAHLDRISAARDAAIARQRRAGEGS